MDKFAPEGMELTLRTLAMPGDTNAAGHIFGGWVMSQMDLAAAVRANEISGGRTVTAAVTDMQFRQPVEVGDTLCVYSGIKKIGRTSVTLELEVWARRCEIAQKLGQSACVLQGRERVRLEVLKRAGCLIAQSASPSSCGRVSWAWL